MFYLVAVELNEPMKIIEKMSDKGIHGEVIPHLSIEGNRRSY